MGIPATNRCGVDRNLYNYYDNGYNVGGGGIQTDSLSRTNMSLRTGETTTNEEKDTVTFKGKEEKSSGKACAIIGAVATIGAAILCKKAYKIGNLKVGTTKATSFFGKVKQAPAKIYDGIKQYINKGCKKIGSWKFKNVNTQEQLSEAKFYEKGWNKVKGWWNSGAEWIGKKSLNVNPKAL